MAPTEPTSSMRSTALRAVFTTLVGLVLLTAFHRRYWSDAYDPYKCSALLNEGRWLDDLESNPVSEPWQIWQPPACLLHSYKADDVAHCASNRQMLFAGDSNIRQLFWSVAKKLDLSEAIRSNKATDKHADVLFKRRGVTLRFIWDPFLNGSTLANELAIHQDNVASIVGGDKKKGSKETPAAMIVIGGGLWYARQFQAGAVRQFKMALDNIIDFTQRPEGSVWKPINPFNGAEGVGDQVFFVPVEEPVYDRLSPARQLTILPEEVDQMNEHLHQLKPEHGLNVPWVFPIMTSRRKYTYEESGLHVLEAIANRRADVLLNLRCNSKVDRAIGAPYERTCCSNYTAGSWIQWVLVIFALGLAVGVFWSSRRQRLGEGGTTAYVLVAFTTVALALSYCFFADRTQLFSKAHKLYNKSEFLSLCGLALAVGLLTVRKSKEPLSRKDVNDVFVQSSQPFLSRDQTDEWKGWMQAIILVYHWTGASSELWIYIVIRLLVGSYLFLTGYGHAMYFYEKADYSIHRVAAVLIRLNLLAVALTYQMYTNYTFYYFAPLVSFWFLVIYATFQFGRELNTGITFLLSKIAFSATVIALIHSQREPLDFIFLLLRKVCGINWDASEWRFRVSLDVFVVYVGILVALLHIWIRTVKSAPQFYRDHTLEDVLLTLFPYLRVIAIVASLIILPGFWALIGRSPNKEDYNWWQPMISFLPILSFVVLRNSTSLLRNYHSAGFAWFGRCSLETFTLQYHIWMASDTKGVLSLGIFNGDGSLRHDRWREFILITPIFLWTSWQVSSATAVVTNWVVAESSSEGLLPNGLGKRKEFRPAPSLRYPSKLAESSLGMRFGLLLGALWLLNLVTN